MREKDKLAADIASKLAKMDEMIADLEKKADERNQADPEAERRMEALRRKRVEVQNKLAIVQQSDDNTWESLKSDLHDFLDDIDKQQREGWAYYK